MKSKNKIFALASIAFELQTVQAAPSDFTHIENYTVDNLSGLQWLDLSQTAGRSYLDVSTDTNLSTAGWHYASGNQLNQFVTNYTGTPLALNTGNPINYSDASNLLSMLGTTGYFYEEPYDDPYYRYLSSSFSPLHINYYAYGITSDIDALQPGKHNLTWLLQSYYSQSRIDLYAGQYSDSWANPTIASFLIRDTLTPIPLPSAIVFFTTGFFCFGALRGKRKPG